jgi:hypothetical protein
VTHRADSRNLRPVGRPPGSAPVAGIRDVILIPKGEGGTARDLRAHPPAGEAPVELSREMTLERLSSDLCELVRAACSPRGHYFHPVHQHGFRYAFVWTLPAQFLEGPQPWDPAGELYVALAFSRLIVDNAHTTTYAARIVDYADDEQQVRSAEATEAAVAFRAHPQARDWMDDDEARQLADLLAKTLAGSSKRVVLPGRVLRANYLQELAVRLRHADVVLVLLVAALEALINTGKPKVTRQFTTRVSALAAEVGIEVSESWCRKVYDERSHGVHGRVVQMFTFQQVAGGVADLAKVQAIIRRTVRRAVDDDSFRAIFESDESVEQRWPV